MPKVFLSHSSADKASYVEYVADKLIEKVGNHNVVYDKYTFEEGMETISEINTHLKDTDLFVLFISDKALESDWVKSELETANKLMEASKLERIYPIIIDRNIEYSDKRIPKWMQERYNIKLVSRPSKSVQLIKERMIEINWKFHPKVADRKKVFVGRNELIKDFEERLDDYEKGMPSCAVVAGIEKIGRTTFLNHCLRKSNVISKQTYEPLEIYLNHENSIEDFILFLYGLGYTERCDITDLMSKGMDIKIDIAIKLISDIQNAKDILFIRDVGCIINYEGVMVDWFNKIIDGLKDKTKLSLCIISKFQMNMPGYLCPAIFKQSILELEKKERAGLLRRYLEIENIELDVNDFQFVLDLLTGFPQQAIYAVDLLSEKGIEYVKSNSYLLVEYSNKKVENALRGISNDDKKMNFLRLLSSLDQMSSTLIRTVTNNDDLYMNILNEFVGLSICEQIGSNKEYIRVNDVIRDYIDRSKLEIEEEFQKKLDIELKTFLDDPSLDSYSVPEYLNNMKVALLKGEKIDAKEILPSIYLKSMRELYEKKGNRLSDVIKFARKALEKESSMDSRIVFEIRYFLCLSLAKMKNKELLTEVQKISGADHNFLLGFYYRQIGKPDKSLEQYNKSLEIRPNFSKAKRELVQVYIMLEEYSLAKQLAKENYEVYPENPYHIQAYFMCTIKGWKTEEEKLLLEKLIEELEKIQTPISNKMLNECKALFEGFCNNDFETALEIIDRSIKHESNKKYGYKVKFDLCEKFKDLEQMKMVLGELNKLEADKNTDQLVSLRSIVICFEEGVESGVAYFSSKIQNYTQQAQDRFIQRLRMKY